MFLLPLVIGYGLAGPPSLPHRAPSTVVVDAMPEPLHAALMAKLNTMSSQEKGIFNEEVSTLVSGYFPKGQTLEETRRTIAARGLGEMQPFMGKMSAEDGIMYVTHFSVMSQAFSHVYVVVDFTFRRDGAGQPKLERTQAFLRASAM